MSWSGYLVHVPLFGYLLLGYDLGCELTLAAGLHEFEDLGEAALAQKLFFAVLADLDDLARLLDLFFHDFVGFLLSFEIYLSMSFLFIFLFNTLNELFSEI